uniref:Uncharacterized protein n=1 Tax=Cannabis sativa TaxID=3483 RepID=A0A803PGV2_CANSA
MDSLEDLLYSPNGPIKRDKKRNSPVEVTSKSNPEALKKKRASNKKAISTNIIIDSGTVAPAISFVPASASIGRQPLGFVHQVKFSTTQPEMVLLEPSCPLSTHVGIEGSQAYSQYATQN